MSNRFLGLGAGKDGIIALGSYTQTWYSCSGSSGATSLSVTGTFSAGDRIFIHQTRGTGAGGYEDNTVASYTTGTITLVHPLLQDYTDSGASQAQVAVVKEVSSVSGSFTLSAWDGNVGGIFVMACNGVFSGTVNATGKGYRGGARGWDFGLNQWGRQGESSLGVGSTSASANGTGGGGAYVRNLANDEGQGGGGGGYATSGTAGQWYINPVNYGLGGGTIGQAELTSLYPGGGGGGGGVGDAGPSGSEGTGGAGGGIIVVYTKSFDSNASLISNGANGTNSSFDQGGGGAGAGGSILIKSISSTIGTSKITANGGSTGTSGSYGGVGGTGRIRIESCSLSGTTSPSASTQTGGYSYCGSLTAIL